MQIETREIMDGQHVGGEMWICHYHQPDKQKKPLRNIPPTRVVVVDNDELPKGKKVYYSSSHFRPLNKDGKPTSRIISPVDNTGFRTRSGTPLFVFTGEQECKWEWNRQLREHIANLDPIIKAAAAHWQAESDKLAGMIVQQPTEHRGEEMQELFFGKGEISVCPGYNEGEERKLTKLFLEPGMGNGEIGGASKREFNKPFDPVENAVILNFLNPESVRVVILELEKIEKDLTGDYCDKRCVAGGDVFPDDGCEGCDGRLAPHPTEHRGGKMGRHELLAKIIELEMELRMSRACSEELRTESELLARENERLAGEIEGRISESSMRHFVAKRENGVVERCVEIAEETQCKFHCNGDEDVSAAIKDEYGLK